MYQKFKILYCFKDFKGEIFSDDVLIVGEGAEVEAEIKVNRVIVYGSVHGNVISPGGINLHAPAKLQGSIATRSLTIEEGVIFDGSCTMQGATAGGTAAPKAISSDNEED